MKPVYRMALLAGVFVSMIPMAACTMTGGSTAVDVVPTPAQRFSEAHFVNAAHIVVDNKSAAINNPKDVSGTFPTPPDVALKQYAETRLKPAGGAGTLRFVIEEASAFKENQDSSNSVARWVGVDEKERYTVLIAVGLQREDMPGMAPGAQGARLKVERTLTIPRRLSLHDRDIQLQIFMNDILADLDRAIVAAVKDTLLLSTVAPAPSPGPFPVEPVDIRVVE